MSIAAHTLVLTAAVAAARPVPKDPPVTPGLIWHPVSAPPPPDCPDCSSGPVGTASSRTDAITYRLPGEMTGEIRVSVSDNVEIGIEGVGISKDEWQGGISSRGHGDTTSVLGREAVDRQVVPLATNPPPRYPAALRSARIEGSVSVRFVVDTTGRVIMSTVIVDAADHALFAEAVIEALRHARFAPAELRGRRVAQLVIQPFSFVIRE